MGLTWSGLMSLPLPNPDNDDAALTGMDAASANCGAGGSAGSPEPACCETGDQTFRMIMRASSCFWSARACCA
ncbi:Uncharacterised protein [Mycobacteroides abscessus]|nr:Uncharacterised protein [Mycobacteroides abscessus]SKF39016.1 Uncharacterised protein [Mycobacteroides abscessus subsp. massiliense]